MRSKRLRNVMWQVLRIAVVALILWFVLRDLDFGTLLNSLRSVRPAYFLLAVGVWLVAVGFASLRWKVLISAISSDTPLLSTFIYNLIGAFYSQFLPGNITGDVVKGYYMARTQAKKAAMLSSAVIDRILGLVINGTIGFIALGFSPILLEVFELPRWVGWAVVVLVVVGVAFGLAVVGWLARFEDRFPTPIAKVYRIIADYVDHLWVLARATILSIVYFLVWAVAIWILAHSARIDVVDYSTALLLLAAVNLVTVLPISVNGLGVREGTVVFLLGQFGVQSERAFVLSLLILAINLLVGIVGGIFVMLDYRHIREEIQKNEEITVP